MWCGGDSFANTTLAISSRCFLVLLQSLGALQQGVRFEGMHVLSHKNLRMVAGVVFNTLTKFADHHVAEVLIFALKGLKSVWF